MAKLLIVNNGRMEPIGWAHFCPGCEVLHTIHTVPTWPGEKVHRMTGTPRHPSFRGTMRYVTVAPLAFSHEAFTTDPKELLRLHEGIAGRDRVCHYIIHHGRILFRFDSTHALRGKTIELPDFALRLPESASEESSKVFEAREAPPDGKETQSPETNRRRLTEGAPQQEDSDAAPPLSEKAAREA
jgi:hypothetical protein